MPYSCEVCRDCESSADIYQSDSEYPSDLDHESWKHTSRHGNSRRNHRREESRHRSGDGPKPSNRHHRYHRTGNSRDRWRHERPRPRNSSPSRVVCEVNEKNDSDQSDKSYSSKSDSSYSSKSESSYSSKSGKSYSSKSNDSEHSDSDSNELANLCVTSPCSSESDDDTVEQTKRDGETGDETKDTVVITEKKSEDSVILKARDQVSESENALEQNESLTTNSLEGKRTKRYVKGHGRNNNYKRKVTHKPHSRVKRSYVKMPTGKKVSLTLPKPKAWKCGTPSTLITLRRNGKMSRYEYMAVAKEMKSSIAYHKSCATGGGCFKKYNIIKIQKIINGCLWKRYRHHQEQILSEVKFTNQRMLFHGSHNIDSIVQTGFDERFSNVQGMFGAGLYFAKHSSKANQYAFGYMGGTGCPTHKDKSCMICERKLLLCRVTLGKTRNFFTANKLAHPPIGYNSVTGLPSSQTGGLLYPEFIVYRGEQVYPEYLITYKISK